jgi:alanine dehydrogenase
VKELQESEYRKPRRGQTVFGFQHFGPQPALLDAALASGATFIAYETVGQADGSLPILAPMSAIAGRLAVQAGAWCLQKQNGGSGVLLSGLEGVAPGKVVILGAGNVGANALAVAHGIGAQVIVFAKSTKRFPPLRKEFAGVRFNTYESKVLEEAVAEADLVIGGVLTPGEMSPKLISRSLLKRMRRGSALVDVGIDQGGIAETSRPSSHSDPIYVEEGVVHYCVPNMPAACARTASFALERAVLPFVFKLSRNRLDNVLETGVQVKEGRLTHQQLARDTGRRYSAP